MERGGEPVDVRLLFPWGDGERLTATLRDPKLWAGAFDSPKTRKLIKAAAKKVLSTRGVPHTDGQQLGEITVRLLETRRGRAALYNELRGQGQPSEAFVARCLRSELAKRGLVLPSRLYRQQGQQREKLDLEALEASPGAFAEWAAEDILLAVAPYAILQRAEARRIASLLQRSEAVAALLQAELPHAMQASGHNGRSNAGDASDASNSILPIIEVPAAAEGVAASPGSSDAPASDERLTSIVAALKTVLDASERAQAAIAAGDMDRGLEELEKARQARRPLQVEYNRLRAREDVVTNGWSIDVPSAAYGDARAAEAWLSELQASLEAHEGHRRDLVHRKREALRADFARVGLSPPEDLDAANTLEQVQVIREREHEAIVVESAWRSMLETRDVTQITKLGKEQRARLTARLLDLRGPPGLALRLFVSDDQVNKMCPLERFVPLIREQIEAGEPLPAGIWRALQDRAGDALITLLDAHGLSLLVTEADEDSLQADELRHVLLSCSLSNTHELYLWTLETRLGPLPPAQRVELLLEIAPVSRSPLPIGLLVGALSASERWSEAVMIAAIALRSGRMNDAAVEFTREAFLRVLIESCQHTDRHTLLKNILMAPGDLVRHEDGFITLLYVATHVEPAFLDTLIYSGSATYEIAVKNHKLLVNEWLLNLRAKLASRDVSKTKEAELLKAQAIYSEWLHERDRKLTHTNWHYAQDFKRHIAEALDHKLMRLDQTGVLADEDPDDLLEEIKDEHRLPMLEGGARRNMQALIRGQMARLQAFAKLSNEHQLRGSLVSTLQSSYRDFRSRLEDEATRASGLVRELYNIALREDYS